MTKKMNQFLRHLIIGDWMFSWFNNSPTFPNRYRSCGWADRILFLWLCFGLWSGCKMQLHSILTHILRTAFLRFPARCRLGPCRWTPWPTYSSHEKFWPMSENCLCLQIQFWLLLHIYLANSWLWLPTRAQFGVHSDPTFWFRWIFVYWQGVLTTGHWICELRILQCLSSWNTVRLQQQLGILHPYKICSLCLVVITFQFVLFFFAIEILHVQPCDKRQSR